MKLLLLTSLIFSACVFATETVVEENPEETAGTFLVETTNKVIQHRRRPCAPSSSSSSSSSDSSCCDECSKVYFDFMDFYTSYPILDPANAPGSTWLYWTYGNPIDVANYYVANKGTTEFGCNGALVRSQFVVADINANVNTDPARDHNKLFAYAATPIPVPPHGDVVVKFQANVQTYKTEDNPFPSAIAERNDYRLASGRFIVFDPTFGFEFSFVLTNNRVFALYQRSAPALTPLFPTPLVPVGVVPNTAYAAFTFLIPVKIRKPCDFHDMAIVVQGDSNTVSYHLDGREVFLLTKLGFLIDRDYLVNDLGGPETAAFPTSVQYGYGTFSALDWYPSCQRSQSCDYCRYPFIREGLVELTEASGYIQYNPIFGESTGQLAVMWDADGLPLSNHAWGQSVVIKMNKLIAYQKVPVCKK